jgi:hypothetical protein
MNNPVYPFTWSIRDEPSGSISLPVSPHRMSSTPPKVARSANTRARFPVGLPLAASLSHRGRKASFFLGLNFLEEEHYMNFKLNALVAAALLVAAGSANAAIDGAFSAKGELMINFISQGGPSASAGGDDISAVFDLGVSMNDFLTHKNQAGYTQTWSLTTANYGSAWNDLLAFSADDTKIEFNVIALDNTGQADAGSRYLTTNDIATYSSLTNANLNGFENMDQYVTANNGRGTHATEVNGASTAVATDPSNTYFRLVNGAGQGDTWLTKTTDTTKTLATAQNFWFLTNNGLVANGQAAKSAFGFDLDLDGILEADNNGSAAGGFSEFGEWSVNAAAGTVTFSNPVAVPEASTYGMMLAGLGLVGFMARRRMNRAA